MHRRAHGRYWAARRDAIAVEVGIWDRMVPVLKGYRTWIVGLYLFGAAALVSLALTLLAPSPEVAAARVSSHYPPTAKGRLSGREAMASGAPDDIEQSAVSVESTLCRWRA